LEAKLLKTGEIYWVNLDPTVGDEIRKRRPVVILNAGHEKHLRLAIVAPVTQWNASWERNPFFVPLEPSAANGLQKKSMVDCFQIRAISHSRFAEKMGVVSSQGMDSVRRSLALILDIDSEHCE
jgi:mRNA interferase MazF